MYKKILTVLLLVVSLFLTYRAVVYFFVTQEETTSSFTETEADFDSEPLYRVETPYVLGRGNNYTLAELRSWTRPDGPSRVGVQIGHLNNEDMPEELDGLEGNTGAIFGGYTERSVNQAIAEQLKLLLEANGVVVDLLPAKVPPGYVADAFISIHADGNANRAVRGFKIAGPRRDYSGQSSALVEALIESYDASIDIPKDDNVTRRMTAYYAFNWPRYEHAIHPFTPAAIVETGFLTNAADRAIIVEQPQRVAEAIAEGVINFLNQDKAQAVTPVTLLEPEQPIRGVVECAPIRNERQGREEDTPCLPSVAVNGTYYVIDGMASTSPQLGSLISVQGTYRPIQFVDNYFWFPYEVAGFIENPIIE